jgi:hypothetical protein
MLCRSLVTLAALAATAAAQTQVVRGDIDDQNNIFFLDCANQVRLVSNTVNLRALHDASRQQDIEYEMQVVDVSSGGQRILDVVSAIAIPEQFNMGNLRLGRADRWEFFAPAGTQVAIFLNARVLTVYVPIPGMGAWLFGGGSLAVRQGITDALGRFQFDVQPPSDPALVGIEFTSQSVFRLTNGTIGISNADCKVVRND